MKHGRMSHFTLYLLLSLSFQTMQALQDIKRLDSLEPRCQKLVIVESCLLELNQCRAMLARQIDKKISIRLYELIYHISIFISNIRIYMYIYIYTYNIHIHICYMLKALKQLRFLVFPLARPWNSGTSEVTEEGEKNGVWDLSLFKVDITLLELHRFPVNRCVLMCFYGYIYCKSRYHHSYHM